MYCKRLNMAMYDALRVVEELCTDQHCRRKPHWHPFDLNELTRNADGEFRIRLRVRTKGIKRGVK